MDHGISILEDLDNLYHNFVEARTEEEQEKAQEKLMNSFAWVKWNLDADALIELCKGLELEFQESIEGMLRDEEGAFTVH